MPSEKAWGKIRGISVERARCPLCRAWLDTVQHWEGKHVIPWHTARLSPGAPSCDGSGKTMTEARALADLRLRAHP